jgi:hypothetical protein
LGGGGVAADEFHDLHGQEGRGREEVGFANYLKQ